MSAARAADLSANNYLQLMKQVVLILSFHFCLTALGQTAEEHYKQASDLYDKKDFSSAITSINKALQKDSKNARYLLLKGNAKKWRHFFQ